MSLPAHVVEDASAQLNFEYLGRLIFAGHGAPTIAAGVGATYHNLDGGAGVTYWVKETGGSTSAGWVAK